MVSSQRVSLLCRLALAACLLLVVRVPEARAATEPEEVRCLTGNAPRTADNARVNGSYSVLMPGLRAPGWPKGPAQKAAPFSRGILTDGSHDTLLEWSDREFGSLGRDLIIDLRDDFFVTKVDVRCRGRNRLRGGTLYLRRTGGQVFMPVRRYGVEDFPNEAARKRKRYEAVVFDDVNAVTRYVRVNVLGSHYPRIAEVQVWGRTVRPADRRDLKPLLPYDPAKLRPPRPVEQVKLFRGLAGIVPQPRLVKTNGGLLRTRLRLKVGYPPADLRAPGLRTQDLKGKRRNNAPWERAGGYRLVVSDKGMELTGFDDAGVRHGLQTLSQIISERGTVPCCEIVDWPGFDFRALRLVPPVKHPVGNREFYERLMRALAVLKFNRVFHLGTSWAVRLKSWPHCAGSALSVDELKQVLRFHDSLGFRTGGAWGIAPATWVMQMNPSRVEARPGEAYLKDGRIDFKRYPNEVLRRLSRVNACPLQDENFETFKAVVDELCAIYKDEYFFAGVDEPLQWYHGSRWGCCEHCRGHDPVQLMADWINKCSDHVRKKHGRIHMYQTTIILKEHQGEEPGYPGGPKDPMYKIIDRMPKDRTALVNWSYGVWRRKKGEPDSSNLNRYLASKGYRQIIQNVGYTDAGFAICDFTKWAGRDGADFVGATVANYGDQSLTDMAHRFKFLDYVVAAEELWSPCTPRPSSRRMASQLVNGLETVREVLEDTRLPSRRAGADDFFAVDLTAHANRNTLDDKPYDGEGWTDLGGGLDLRALPRGRLELCGQPFVLMDPGTNNHRSCIMVQNAKSADATLPAEVKGVAVGRTAASLVFLHALTDAMERRSTGVAFTYRITYEDGTHAEFPVRYRVQVMEWLDRSTEAPGDMRIGWFLHGARPAWLGETGSGERAILYAAEWVNPHPENPIRTVDVVLPETSQAHGAALFAISGVKAE